MDLRKVATLSSLPHDRGVKVEHGGEKIVLVRDGDTVHAYSDECPHAGGPLHEGAVCNGRIICPWHKGAFSVVDGSLAEPPALTGLVRYTIELEGDDVYLGGKAEAAPWPGKKTGGGIALIIGAGAAGAAAVSALREFGYSGRIVLAGQDAPQPYDRTSLSKFVMAGEMPPNDVPPLLPADFFAQHDVERVESEVQQLDIWQRRAVFANGETLDFGTALICTGGNPSKLDIPGADLPGVHVLRSSADAASIVADLKPGARAVILGTSFIGLEVASGLRSRKIEVTVVGPDEIPFARQFGEEIGRSLRELHESNGVVFHTGTRATSLQGETHVTGATLENGQTLPADIVLMAVGVKPITGFIQGLEREHDGGLKTDAAMRIAPSIFAAGDVAFFPLPHGDHARIEHWRVAQQQARVAALNMAGGSATYDGVPFFWTYHYSKNIEYLGHAEKWDKLILHGDPRQQDFVALLCKDGHVAAIVACNHERETALLIEAMRAPLTPAAALSIIDAQAPPKSEAA